MSAIPGSYGAGCQCTILVVVDSECNSQELDFLQGQQIIAYSPNCNPEFSLCNVSTDTTPQSTTASFQTMRPQMFQHVNPKFINLLLKHMPLEEVLGLWAWFTL